MAKPLDTSKRFGTRGEYLVVIQMVLVALFIFIPAWPDFRNGDLYRQLTLLRWIVLLIGIVVGTILGIGGSLNIRKYLTPLPYPVDNNQLVDTGFYALVRHPLYSAQLFAAAGWAAFTLSLSHLLVTIAAYIFFNYKASKEESWLMERHPEYREYASRVGNFLPGVGTLKK